MIVVPDAPVEVYGRLLPVIEAFRADARYTVIETVNAPNVAYYLREAVSVEISGRTTIADIEKRFVLPAGLSFNRVNQSIVHLADDGIGISFHPPRSKWWQGWRAWEGEPKPDSMAGDHTVHHSPPKESPPN